MIAREVKLDLLNEQIGEKAEIDPKRTSVETTIGATAGAVLSVGFAGAGELARRLTRVPRARVEAAQRKVFYNLNKVNKL